MAEDEISGEGVITEPTMPSTMFDVDKYVPEDLRAEKYWDSFKGKDMKDVMKSSWETKKMVGNAIQLPKEDDAEGWSKVYDKLGRPKDHKEYTFETKFEGLQFDEELLDGFKAAAHKQGMPAKMFTGIMDHYTQSLYNQTEKMQKEDLGVRNAVDLEMKEKYAANYEFASAVGKRAIRELVKDEEGAKMIEEVMIRNPKVFQAMVAEGERMRSHGTIDGVTPFNFNGIEPAGAKAEINKVLNDPTHPYHDQKKPGYTEAVQSMENMYKVAYPD